MCDKLMLILLNGFQEDFPIGKLILTRPAYTADFDEIKQRFRLLMMATLERSLHTHVKIQALHLLHFSVLLGCIPRAHCLFKLS
jgi:hypothetical protein